MTSAGGANKHAKLPQLGLKYFAGEPSQWLTFWDSFGSTVYEKPRIAQHRYVQLLEKPS